MLRVEINYSGKPKPGN